METAGAVRRYRIEHHRPHREPMVLGSAETLSGALIVVLGQVHRLLARHAGGLVVLVAREAATDAVIAEWDLDRINHGRASSQGAERAQ